MSALTLEAVSGGLAAVLAAFAGSPHCALMCGPIRVLSPQSWRARAAYQAGRAVSYSALGAAAGWFGWSIPPWTLVSVIGVAAGFHLLGAWPKAWRSLQGSLLAKATGNPLTLGVSSALLPCGLLHAWILVAAATASPLRGALVLSALWLGTMPALELGSWALARPIQKVRARFPRALPIALALFAFTPAIWRAHAAASPTPMACHHHMANHQP
ncbi:MAG: sulfite exporter TauE/SafE family protein [Bdellovibrionota bacterium]